MTHRLFSLVLLLFLCGRLGFSLHSAEPAAAGEGQPKQSSAVTPGPMDGRIAYWTSELLVHNHYLHQAFDENVSKKFLDRYVEALDPQHMHFTQSDLDKFQHYGTNLNQLTKSGDVRPSCEIFQCFLTRLSQRVAYADELLKNERFTFDTDERISVNRHELPYPKDLDAAKVLWRDRLRFEYLQERLAKIDARKKAQTSKTKKNDAANPDGKPKTETEEIVDTLSHRYHRTLRTYTDWNNEDVLQAYLTTLAHVYDPHSDYFGKSQLESFAISMNLSLFGIGAELVSEDGYCTIRRLLPGGPAIKSDKIKEKDRIIAVAQGSQPFVDVVDMNLTKAVQLIRGPKGTDVRLKLLPAGDSAPTVITLRRDEIKLEDSYAKSKIIELPSGASGESLRLGVIDLPSFYANFDLGGNRGTELAGDKASGPKSTTADVLQLLKKLKQENVAGIVLDLRRNGGGSLEEAIKLTGLFIKEGPIVQVKSFDPVSRKANIEEDPDPDPTVAYSGPLIVLTSKFSASASEILAGALQDYGRALIVGDSSTHGKGTVQSVNMLRNFLHLPPTSTNEPGALKLTIKKFYRASGISTQLKGVTPDIVLPSVFNDMKDIGESALENPLGCDKIDPAKYERLNLVAPYLPELKTHSVARVASEREFDYVREDIEQYKKLQADKTISLNEKQRLKEKEEIEARQKARDKERLARKEPDQKVYEITLKQCDLPGLPPPVEKTNNVAKVSGGKINIAPGDTNLTASSSSDVPPDPAASEDADEEKPSPHDATLVEVENILRDYIAMFQKKDSLTAGNRADGVVERKD